MCDASLIKSYPCFFLANHPKNIRIRKTSSLTSSSSSSSLRPARRQPHPGRPHLHPAPHLFLSSSAPSSSRNRSAPRVLQGQHSPHQALPQARSQRILQGRAPDSDRVRRDGFRRVLRQADLHPHQQYHRWICLGIYWI
ncbi:unnamed protein product [Malus baccata var. baccata]